MFDCLNYSLAMVTNDQCKCFIDKTDYQMWDCHQYTHALLAHFDKIEVYALRALV